MAIIAALMLMAAGSDASQAAILKTAKEAVTHDFLDPGSAQFRGVKVVVTPMGLANVCGEVNGKNRFGAYVGFRRFVYAAAGVASIDDHRPVAPLIVPAWESCGHRVNDLGYLLPDQ